MTNELNPTGIQTTLNQTPFGFDLLAITTSLMFLNGMNSNELARKLNGQTPNGFCQTDNRINLLADNDYFSAGTIDVSIPSFIFASTTLSSATESDIFDSDFFVNPNPKRQFKLKVKSLRIIKSLPQYFED